MKKPHLPNHAVEAYCLKLKETLSWESLPSSLYFWSLLSLLCRDDPHDDGVPPSFIEAGLLNPEVLKDSHASRKLALLVQDLIKEARLHYIPAITAAMRSAPSLMGASSAMQHNFLITCGVLSSRLSPLEAREMYEVFSFTPHFFRGFALGCAASKNGQKMVVAYDVVVPERRKDLHEHWLSMLPTIEGVKNGKVVKCSPNYQSLKKMWKLFQRFDKNKGEEEVFCAEKSFFKALCTTFADIPTSYSDNHAFTSKYYAPIYATVSKFIDQNLSEALLKTLLEECVSVNRSPPLKIYEKCLQDFVEEGVIEDLSFLADKKDIGSHPDHVEQKRNIVAQMSKILLEKNLKPEGKSPQGLRKL